MRGVKALKKDVSAWKIKGITMQSHPSNDEGYDRQKPTNAPL